MKRAFIYRHAFVPTRDGAVITEAAYDSRGRLIASKLRHPNVAKRLIHMGYKIERIFHLDWVNMRGRTFAEMRNQGILRKITGRKRRK